jgi:hypothetical protein
LNNTFILPFSNGCDWETQPFGITGSCVEDTVVRLFYDSTANEWVLTVTVAFPFPESRIADANFNCLGVNTFTNWTNSGWCDFTNAVGVVQPA